MQLRSLYIKMADEADDPVLLLEEEALREQLRRARQEMEALTVVGAVMRQANSAMRCLDATTALPLSPLASRRWRAWPF